MSMLTDHETACLILALRDDKQRLMRDLAAARADFAASQHDLNHAREDAANWKLRASKLNSEETIVLPTARLSPASSGSP